MPINLAYDEAQQRLVDVINSIYNELQIPYFLIEILLKDVYMQASSAAQQEKKSAQAQYDKMLKAEKEKQANQLGLETDTKSEV